MQIAIASGKGGTGKTTVAVTLFHLLGKYLGERVHLVDCDVEEPDDLLFFPSLQLLEQKKVYQSIPEIDTSLCTFCKRCAVWCAFNAITVVVSRKFAVTDSSLCHSCGACMAACQVNAISEKPHMLGTVSRYRTEEGNAFTEGRLVVGSTMQTMLIRKLKREVLQEGMITLLDAPPGTSCPVVETVSDADYVILVTEPTPFGLHDLKITVELIRELKKPFGVIVNKAGLGSGDLYGFLEENNIELLGEIPFSRELAMHYASGNLLQEIPAEMKNVYDRIVLKLNRDLHRSGIQNNSVGKF